MLRRSVLPFLPLLCALGLLAACGGEDKGAAAGPKGPGEFFPIRLGERTVRMQIAALPDEMQRGLMFRQSLGRDEGMLFVFTRPQQMGFWMRNTTLPLDIGYFDAAGELKEIYPLHPLDERSVTSRARNLQFALEVNQGWFRDNGVKPGAKLDLKAVAEALRARGLKPEIAGLH
jgi:uncharacterized membrane protein (UPF0127 family)